MQACVQASCPDETAIVLVHGYGGGAFAWRNIMQPLADAAGCRVIAFDRPAFGTSSNLLVAVLLMCKAYKHLHDCGAAGC